jgi:hypothetical protein
MKSKIKRKQIIVALEYAGLSYLPDLLRNREINVIDKNFFKALHSDINKLHNTLNSTRIAFDNLNNRFVELAKEKELLTKELNEKTQMLLEKNDQSDPLLISMKKKQIENDKIKQKLISEIFGVEEQELPVNN